MLRLLVVIGIVAAVQAPLRAEPTGDAVALLPLDADQRLELYGQPVASEVARQLVAGGIDVVVVGPKMAVPSRARLIVDGTIKAGKGDAVTLTLRIRDPRDGTVLEMLESAAPALTSIDKAAEDLSGRVLPAVKSHLAALTKPKPEAQAPDRAKPPVVVAAPVVRPLLAAIVAQPGTEALRAPLVEAAAGWARDHHREPKPLDGAKDASAVTVKSLAGAELGIALEIRAFTIAPGAVPTARARVRLRVVDGTHVAFDRVIVTDTIVGDRGLTPALLAARVAREVLAIADPHVRRAVAGWR